MSEQHTTETTAEDQEMSARGQSEDDLSSRNVQDEHSESGTSEDTSAGGINDEDGQIPNPAKPEDEDQDTTEGDDTGPDDPQDDGGKLRKIRKEAATYRQRARDAETERDTLRDRVEALEWREVQRHIPKGAPKLEALQKLGLELDEVRDDTGDIDPAKVNTVVEAAAELVGISLHSSPRMPLEGKTPASQGIPADVATSLQKALTGK